MYRFRIHRKYSIAAKAIKVAIATFIQGNFQNQAQSLAMRQLQLAAGDLATMSTVFSMYSDEVNDLNFFSNDNENNRML